MEIFRRDRFGGPDGSGRFASGGRGGSNDGGDRGFKWVAIERRRDAGSSRFFSSLGV